MFKATHTGTKTHNTQFVLRTIYRHSPLSRAQIAAVTNLTPPTVSKIVSELQAKNLVVDIGVGESTGGKRPRLLAVNKDEPYVLAVDIGDGEFQGALVNLYGSIKRRVALPVKGHTGSAAVDTLHSLIHQLFDAADKPIMGIGVGSPGLINSATGVVERSVNLEWQGLALKQILADDFEQPIYIVNDCLAGALGELIFGDGDERENLVLLRLGKGVGAGLVLNSRLYNGDGFGAGEIGHTRFDTSNTTTFEDLLSVDSLLKQARALTNSDLTWAEFVARVAEADTALTEIVQQTADTLGIMLAHLISTLNVHNIVLSGPVCDLGEVLIQPAHQAAISRVLPSFGHETTLTVSALGSDLVLVGCTALVLHQELGVI